MAYGLQIFNDNDKLQIGTDVSNFYMCQKGTINIQAGYEWDAFIYPTITPSVSYDGVAVCFDTGNKFWYMELLGSDTIDRRNSSSEYMVRTFVVTGTLKCDDIERFLNYSDNTFIT